jgi:hypothetical protein
MRSFPSAVLLTVTVMAAGCYHATIETGLTPSGQTISKPWAASFVYGLVSPSTVEAMSKCPDGVAKVETQLSFLNQVVNVITLGIYTPMTIEVQCAAPRTGAAESNDLKVGVESNSTIETKQQVISDAVHRATRSKAPVYVVFD